MTIPSRSRSNLASSNLTTITGGRAFVGRPISCWDRFDMCPERCAIYARPTIMAGPVAKQVAASRKIAHQNEWSVYERFVLVDEAISPGAWAGRSGLEELIDEAEAETGSFQYLIVAHLSALSENIDTVAKLIKLFNSCGIIVCCVSHHIVRHDPPGHHEFTMFF